MIKILKLQVWGRDFSLPVEYDCYDDEIVTNAQINAVKVLTIHPEWIVAAKAQAERFCKEEVLAYDENNKKDNIFSYIKPDYLFVKREDNPRVALMCRYRYDIEHGLAIVFATDGSVTVGLQDIIL